MKPKARTKTQVSIEPLDQTVLQFWSLHFFYKYVFSIYTIFATSAIFLMKFIALNFFVQLI